MTQKDVRAVLAVVAEQAASAEPDVLLAADTLVSVVIAVVVPIEVVEPFVTGGAYGVLVPVASLSVLTGQASQAGRLALYASP
jgi:hypothetical protein